MLAKNGNIALSWCEAMISCDIPIDSMVCRIGRLPCASISFQCLFFLVCFVSSVLWVHILNILNELARSTPQNLRLNWSGERDRGRKGVRTIEVIKMWKKAVEFIKWTLKWNFINAMALMAFPAVCLSIFKIQWKENYN